MIYIGDKIKFKKVYYDDNSVVEGNFRGIDPLTQKKVIVYEGTQYIVPEEDIIKAEQ